MTSGQTRPRYRLERTNWSLQFILLYSSFVTHLSLSTYSGSSKIKAMREAVCQKAELELVLGVQNLKPTFMVTIGEFWNLLFYS